jgi:enoyl-CoA hydratase/carnithine racemase
MKEASSLARKAMAAVTASGWPRLSGLIGEIGADDAVRAVVLTGAGIRSFRMDSDIGEVDAYPEPWQFRNRRAGVGASGPLVAA